MLTEDRGKEIGILVDQWEIHQFGRVAAGDRLLNLVGQLAVSKMGMIADVARDLSISVAELTEWLENRERKSTRFSFETSGEPFG